MHDCLLCPADAAWCINEHDVVVTVLYEVERRPAHRQRESDELAFIERRVVAWTHD
jgi:hypothetical protein